MIEEVKEQVYEILKQDKSGHGTDHITRVLALSLSFASKEKQKVDTTIVSLIALLHDIDDYKLFGKESALDLTNAKSIMTSAHVDEVLQEQVLSEIKCLGFNKRLKGISPNTIEGKIVSDADMCDTLGSTGIVRVILVGTFVDRPFFDKENFPVLDMSSDNYLKNGSSSSVSHFFEKILKLKSMMLTIPGKNEAKKRHDFIIEFLYHLFEEEHAPEWTEYLNNYLKDNN